MRMRVVLATVLLAVATVPAALCVRTMGPSGYSVDAPKGWKTKANPGGIPEFFVLGPRADGFGPNLNVVTVPAPAGATLQQILAATPQTLKAMFTDWKSLSSGNTTLAGSKAVYLEYTAKMGTPKRTLWFRQVYVIRQGKMYTFTCTATLKGRAASAKTFTAMMQSVRWS